MLIDSSTSSCIQRRAVEGASIWDQCNGYRNDFISEQKAAPVCLFGMQGAATWKTVLKIGPAGTHTQRSIIYHIDELPVSRLELGNREGDSSRAFAAQRYIRDTCDPSDFPSWTRSTSAISHLCRHRVLKCDLQFFQNTLLRQALERPDLCDATSLASGPFTMYILEHQAVAW